MNIIVSQAIVFVCNVTSLPLMSGVCPEQSVDQQVCYSGLYAPQQEVASTDR